MARLPVPGSDDGTWGDILNDFLSQEHNTDGSQKTLPIPKGGTGATSASGARTNLGLAIGTDVQAQDSDLAAIAALSTTGFGRSLLELANQPTLLSAAGAAAASHAHAGEDITSGTVADGRIASTIARDSEVAASYQPLDSDLTAIAALTTTAFGRSLLEAANAAALRSLAGLVIDTDVPSQASVVLKSLLDAKGDLISASANDTPVRVAVGTNGQGLIADSTQAAGVTWADRSQVLITNTVLGSDTANFDFTSIPATFNHLKLLMMLRGTTAATNVACAMRFNNDSGNNYDRQYLNGAGTAASAAEAFAQSSAGIASPAAASAGAGLFSMVEVIIPYYASTAFNKVAHSTAHRKLGTATTDVTIFMASHHWRSSTAINRVTISPAAGNWVTGSAAGLYGIL